MIDDSVLVKVRRLIADALTPASGTTARRPTTKTVGYQYYDTTLGKPIWWNGTVWKDAAGVTV